MSEKPDDTARDETAPGETSQAEKPTKKEVVERAKSIKKAAKAAEKRAEQEKVERAKRIRKAGDRRELEDAAEKALDKAAAAAKHKPAKDLPPEMLPSRYIEKVSLVTDEVLGETIEPRHSAGQPSPRLPPGGHPGPPLHVEADGDDRRRGAWCARRCAISASRAIGSPSASASCSAASREGVEDPLRAQEEGILLPLQAPPPHREGDPRRCEKAKDDAKRQLDAATQTGARGSASCSPAAPASSARRSCGRRPSTTTSSRWWC